MFFFFFFFFIIFYSPTMQASDKMLSTLSNSLSTNAMNSIPFWPKRTKNLILVCKPEWDTLLFHLGENFSLFRCVSGVSINFDKFCQTGTHFGLSLLKRKITATRSSIEEMKKKKGKKKKVIKAWSTAGVREKNTKEEEEKKEEKRDWREHLNH